MSGFGHRVYKNYDPRARVIKKLAEEVFSIVGRDPLIEVWLSTFTLSHRCSSGILFSSTACIYSFYFIYLLCFSGWDISLMVTEPSKQIYNNLTTITLCV